MNADSDSLAQVDPNDPVIWSTRLRKLHTRARRTTWWLIELGIFAAAFVLFTILNRGLVKGGVVGGVFAPLFLDGFGGMGMAISSFLNSARLLHGMRLECTDTHLRLLDGERPIWTGRLDTIIYVAVLASRDLHAFLVPRMILIQTDSESKVAGALQDPSPKDDHGPQFLAASGRSLLIPDAFEFREIEIADRIVRRAGLTGRPTQFGVPSGLRVVRSWCRTAEAHATCRDDPIVLQRWRMFAGVCPVCRFRLPVFQWFSFNTDRVCAQCGAALHRHAPRIPAGYTALISSALIAWALNQWFSLADTPYLYDGVFFGLYFPAFYCLVRRLTRYSAVTPAGAYCRECGYDLRGCAEGRCSECGTPTVQ